MSRAATATGSLAATVALQLFHHVLDGGTQRVRDGAFAGGHGTHPVRGNHIFGGVRVQLEDSNLHPIDSSACVRVCVYVHGVTQRAVCREIAFMFVWVAIHEPPECSLLNNNPLHRRKQIFDVVSIVAVLSYCKNALLRKDTLFRRHFLIKVNHGV